MVKAHNASDPLSVMEEEKKEKNKRDQELADVEAIISRPEGIRFFRRMMEIGSVFSTTFTGNSQGFFREGHRNFALIFFNDIAEAARDKIADLIEKEEENGEVA